jgi:hypothetical protein
MEDELKQTVKECNRIFVGYQPNIYDSLCKSKIFVSIIERDNYPSQSILEAMACQNALILSDRGDSNRFSNRKNAVFIQPHKDELKFKLTDLIIEEDKILKMGKESFLHVSTAFDSKLFIQTIIKYICN